MRIDEERNIESGAWRWTDGAATALGDFGIPLTTTDYAVCVYDASAGTQPRLSAVLPAGNTCPRRSCWTMTSTGGVTYRDSERTPDGVQSLKFRPGAAGESAITLALAGSNVGMPHLPVTLPVRVQLINSDGTACWEASYSNAIANDTAQFTARSD